MNESVIVYGPQGSGKTFNAELIKQHLGLKTIVDGWQPGEPYPSFGALVLTNCTFEQLKNRKYIISIDAVKKQLGIK